MTNKSFKNIDLYFIFTVILKYKFVFFFLGIFIFSLFYFFENNTQENKNFYSLKFKVYVIFDEDIHLNNLIKLKTLEGGESYINELLSSVSNDFSEIKKTLIQVLINNFNNKKNISKAFENKNIFVDFGEEFFVYSLNKSDIFSNEEAINIEIKFFSDSENINENIAEKTIKEMISFQEKKYQEYVFENFKNDTSRILSLFVVEEEMKINEIDFYLSYIQKIKDNELSKNLSFELLSKIAETEAKLKSIQFSKLNFMKIFKLIESNLDLPEYELDKINYRYTETNKNFNKIIPYLIFSFLLSLVLLIIFEIIKNIKLNKNH